MSAAGNAADASKTALPAHAVRKIIHVDMDAFFASVEQRDNPQLRGLPVVVGGNPNSRGVVAAASYEARRFGVRSAMPCAAAAKLCPEAVFVSSNFGQYKAVSQQIRALFDGVSDKVEPLSLDEAYLDVTAATADGKTASEVASELRAAIFEKTELTASAGVSYNKFLAKMASEVRKPNGQFVIAPEHGEAFVAGLAIGDFYGVGPATEAKMQRLGIYNGADLRLWELGRLQQHFGKWAPFLYNIARGRDDRPVEARGQRKSLGAETTFAKNLRHPDAIMAALDRLAERLGGELSKHQLQACTLTLKARYPDFTTVTRQCSAPYPLRDVDDIRPLIAALLDRTEATARSVRLVGLSLSTLLELGDMSGRTQQYRLPGV